jgi:hypothetical protein
MSLSPRHRRLVGALVLVLSGCQPASSLLVAIATESTLPIHQLIVDASFGAKNKTLTLSSTATQPPLAFPIFATILLPVDATGKLKIIASGYNENMDRIATGGMQTQVSPGHSYPLSLLLGPLQTDMATPPDMTELPDLSPSDMTERPCLYELCEGFEAGMLNTKTWTEMITDPSKMTIAIVNTMAHSGSHALHLHSDALAKGAQMITLISEAAFVPTTTQPLYLRAWFYADAWPPMGVGHDSLIEAKVGGATGEALQIQTSNQPVDQGSAELLDFNAYNIAPMGVYKAGHTPLPTKSWFCLEWGIDYNGQNMLLHNHTWLDDSLQLSLEADVPMAAFKTIQLGMDVNPTEAQGPLNLWIDDIVISSAYVPCAN